MRDIKKLKFDLHSTFFPGQPIDNPMWFAGRKHDIERALKALCRPGASLMVYGDRGVGKSSFVEMVKLIATGNSHLIYRHGFHKLFPPDKFKFRIIAVECDSETNTTNKVLQRLITSPYGIRQIINGKIDRIEKTVKDKFTIDLLKLFSGGFENENKTVLTDFKEESTIEIFSNLVQTISKDVLSNGEGLLIAIDEFDLVEDNSKMASLIKTLSKNNVKFLISGIADSYENLIAGHQSVMRQFFEGRVQIDPMKPEEIRDIYKLVEENSKGTLCFNEKFVDEVVDKSHGFPYYAQLFGQLGLDIAMERDNSEASVVVTTQHLKQGLEKLVEYEPILNRQYLEIIGENQEKEFVLKALARQIPKKIIDSHIFSYCTKNNLKDPKSILASLLSYRNPQFLIREKDSQYVYFSNSLFKTFVNSREPSLVKIIDNELKLS